MLSDMIYHWQMRIIPRRDVDIPILMTKTNRLFSQRSY